MARISTTLWCKTLSSKDSTLCLTSPTARIYARYIPKYTDLVSQYSTFWQTGIRDTISLPWTFRHAEHRQRMAPKDRTFWTVQNRHGPGQKGGEDPSQHAGLPPRQKGGEDIQIVQPDSSGRRQVRQCEAEVPKSLRPAAECHLCTKEQSSISASSAKVKKRSLSSRLSSRSPSSVCTTTYAKTSSATESSWEFATTSSRANFSYKRTAPSKGWSRKCAKMRTSTDISPSTASKRRSRTL